MLYSEDVLWIVIVGFIIAFVLAFGIGANDVANSFGTSVGAKVLTLTQACVLATFCEFLGALLLGMKVSGTIRDGIVKSELLNDDENGPKLMLLGYLSSLIGACIWLLVATFFRLPVSGTHSIVGAVMGFGLVLFGINGIHYMVIIKIVISWFISPFLSGGISVLFFLILKKTVLEKPEGLEPALLTLPLIFGVCIIVNIFSILQSAPENFQFDYIPLYGKIIISFGLGIISAVIVKLLINPKLRVRILRQVNQSFPNNEKMSFFARTIKHIFPCWTRDPETKVPTNATTMNEIDVDAGVKEKQRTCLAPHEIEVKMNNSVETKEDDFEVQKTGDDIIIKDRQPEAKVFSYAQIVTAIFGSFAHGGNDVSNAIGPLIAIWLIGTTGFLRPDAETPIYLLIYGGVGITVGLWVWGRRVIQTLGEDLTAITPSSGLSIELGSALTVLLASNIGIPVSTTHCKVGSVVLVGRFRSKENVNWKIMRNILIAWLVTVPASAAISALCMYLLKFAV